MSPKTTPIAPTTSAAVEPCCCDEAGAGAVMALIFGSAASAYASETDWAGTIRPFAALHNERCKCLLTCLGLAFVGERPQERHAEEKRGDRGHVQVGGPEQGGDPGEARDAGDGADEVERERKHVALARAGGAGSRTAAQGDAGGFLHRPRAAQPLRRARNASSAARAAGSPSIGRNHSASAFICSSTAAACGPRMRIFVRWTDFGGSA